jgi:oligopeptide/dipeptide ABC transporter ATP-binding protein
MAEKNASDTPQILEIRNLSVTYHSSSRLIQAVRDVSFRIHEGETLALVGETGSGKSTIALAILGLLDSHDVSGEILYRGREMRSVTASDWKNIRGREIGMIFQDARSALNPVQSILDLLIETLRAHQKVSRKDARNRALELLQEVGIQESQEKLHSFELSGGMCQRVGIALGISNQPRLLIADEPTSAIDTALQSQMLDLLHSLKQRHGLALLLISHDLPLISQISDRISVMYHGRIVESGRKEEVLGAPAHPYSRSLLQCQPSFLHHHQQNPLAAIPGSIPRAGQEFPGCAFVPRCDHSSPHCGKSIPKVHELSSSHRVACFNHDTNNG